MWQWYWLGDNEFTTIAIDRHARLDEEVSSFENQCQAVYNAPTVMSNVVPAAHSHAIALFNDQISNSQRLSFSIAHA
jgi:hypothetical protein